MATRKIKPVESAMSNQPRHELLQVADVVAREKGIERDEVLVAMEQAIQKAAKAKYGFENDIRVSINRNSGEVTICKYLTVVEEPENTHAEITLAQARLKKKMRNWVMFLKNSCHPLSLVV